MLKNMEHIDYYLRPRISVIRDCFTQPIKVNKKKFKNNNFIKLTLILHSKNKMTLIRVIRGINKKKLILH